MVTADLFVLSLLPALLWGLEPIFSKRGMAAGGSALQATLIVVLIDAIVFWAVLLALSGFSNPLIDIEIRGLGIFLISGVIGTAIGRLALFAGVHRVGASVNTAVTSTRPLFATSIAFLWLQEPVGPLTIIGIGILVIGLVILGLSRGGDLAGWTGWELSFPLMAAVAFAVGNVIRRFGLTTTDLTALQGVALNETGALIVLVVYFFVKGRSDVVRAPPETYRYFLVSGGLTVIALISMFEAFNRGPVAIVDPITGTAPLFTTVFSYLYLRDLERVTKGIVVGAILVVVGAGFIVV